jgi:hypothetical protein
VIRHGLASRCTLSNNGIVEATGWGEGIMPDVLTTLVSFVRAILVLVGGAAFGAVIGWLVYRTVSRAKQTQISDLAAIVGAVGGAAVTALFPASSMGFTGYCIGLAVGFFLYLRARKKADPEGYGTWMGIAQPSTTSSGRESSRPPGGAVE